MRIHDILIKQFRGIKDTRLENFGEVNILVGGNNSGKTTVLEAIDLHCHPLDILRFVTISTKRDSDSAKLPILDSVRWMFPIGATVFENAILGIEILAKSDYGTKLTSTIVEEVKILEHGKQGILEKLIAKSVGEILKDYNFDSEANIKKRVNNEVFAKISEENSLRIDMIQFDISEDGDKKVSVNDTFIITNFAPITQEEKKLPSVPCQFITPIDHRSLPISSDSLTKIILAENKPKVLEVLRLFDKDIEDIQILSPDGNVPVPYFAHKKLGFVPISVFGDGIRRALTLAAAVVNSRGGVLLIDEIETAIHVRALRTVFSWLVKACKMYDVQLFATTHSLEAVDAIRASYKKLIKTDKEKFDSSNMVAYKLLSNGSKTTAKRLSFENLSEIRDELGLDVR